MDNQADTSSWSSRGNSQPSSRTLDGQTMPKRQGEPQPAVSFFADSVRRAMAQQLPVGELFTCAAKLKLLLQKQQIVELYKAWIAHNPNDPLLYAVYFNYGVSLNENDDRFGAVNALRECIRLKSDFYPPY